MYTEYVTSETHTHGFFDDNEKLQLINCTVSNMFNIDDNQNKFHFYDTEDRIARLNNGYYTPDHLAIELQRAINAVSGSQMYAVTVIDCRLKIEATQEFRIMMKKRKHQDTLRELTGFWSNTDMKNIHIGRPMCIDRKIMIIGRGKFKGCFIVESGNAEDRKDAEDRGDIKNYKDRKDRGDIKNYKDRKDRKDVKDRKDSQGKVLYLTNDSDIDSQPYIEIVNLSGHHPILDSITLNFKGLGLRWMTSEKYSGQINPIIFDYGYIQFKS